VKAFTFRPPGFSKSPLVTVPMPDMTDLDNRTLGRLVCEMRHRLMIRDTLTTIERLYWSTSVSQACWSTIFTAALTELHARALTDHAVWRATPLSGREALSAETTRALAAFRERRARAGDPTTTLGSWAAGVIADRLGALGVNPADAQISHYAHATIEALANESQSDNAIAAERCKSEGGGELLGTALRCQGPNGHQGQHWHGPHAARTWWA
jgi:hypothetical protein